MRTVSGYVLLALACALVVALMSLLTIGLRNVGADPRLAGLVFVPVLVAGYLLTRARP